MSFGFGVGDFALFTKFATKVIKALRDEGDGSKIEYQIAERQCQGFVSAAGELQSLDLSQLPETARDSLMTSAKNLTDITEGLKKTIQSYETSLGENSKKG